MLLTKFWYMALGVINGKMTRGLIKQVTLLEPFVNENGRSDSFIFDGSYTVANRGYNNYIQLGFIGHHSNGILQSIEPIKRKNFKVDISFTFDYINGSGNGFGIWISSPLELGNLYGRNKNYIGLGVCISTTGKPYIQYLDSNGNKSNKLYIPNLNVIQTLTIIIQHPNITIYYTNGKNNVKQLLWKGQLSLDPGVVFGISGHTGLSTTIMKIFSVTGIPVKRIEETVKIGETQKSNFLVTLIGIVSIICLVYYLYTTQAKKAQY